MIVSFENVLGLGGRLLEIENCEAVLGLWTPGHRKSDINTLDRDSKEVLDVSTTCKLRKKSCHRHPGSRKHWLCQLPIYDKIEHRTLMSSTFSNDSLMTLYGDSDVQIFAAVGPYRFTELLSVYGCFQLLGGKSGRH